MAFSRERDRTDVADSGTSSAEVDLDGSAPEAERGGATQSTGELPEPASNRGRGVLAAASRVANSSPVRGLTAKTSRALSAETRTRAAEQVRLRAEAIAGPESRARVTEQIKRVAADDRTRTVLKHVGSAAAAAALAEYHRRQSTTPSTTGTSTDAVSAPGGAAASQQPPGSRQWPPPSWQSGPETSPSEPPPPEYPPFELLTAFAHSCVTHRHPQLRSLTAEATHLVEGRRPALAFEWPPTVPRIFFDLDEVPADWVGVCHDEIRLPIQVRRSGAQAVMCQWLEPTAEQLRDQGAVIDPPPLDKGRAEARAKLATNTLDRINQTGASARYY